MALDSACKSKGVHVIYYDTLYEMHSLERERERERVNPRREPGRGLLNKIRSLYRDICIEKWKDQACVREKR